MDYITTTDLRTKSSTLIETLQKGRTVRLIHRSKVVGFIKPGEEKPFNAKKFIEATKGLKLPKTTYAQREKIYRKHIMEKYGKGLS